MMEPLYLIPILFPVFFVAIWCLVLFILSRVSGWSRLARRYEAHAISIEPVVRFASARFGVTNYNGVLSIAADDRGFHLVPVRIFRPFHRPLYIPWSDVRAELRGKTLRPGCRLTFPAVPRVSCRVGGRTLEALLPHLSMALEDQ